MKVLVSGSSGLIGKALLATLLERKIEVTRLVRSETKKPDEIYWDPMEGTVDAGALEDFDVVVHLAGENVASGRWTAAKKEKIRKSRVNGTKYLSNMLLGLSRPPKVLVCASAIGFYGNRGDEVLDENCSSGSGFLSEVCKEWEKATQAAMDKGIRVVHLRIGMVLSTQGGALKKMLFPFKMGGGGILGKGDQYMSWITLGDVIGGILFAIQNENLSGPVNLVSPNPVSNREFTKTLGRVLSRPTFISMPKMAARIAFGELADALLLASTRVEPKKLKENGFTFRSPKLEDALNHVLEN